MASPSFKLSIPATTVKGSSFLVNVPIIRIPYTYGLRLCLVIVLRYHRSLVMYALLALAVVVMMAVEGGD